jgi:hypothetical protein
MVRLEAVNDPRSLLQMFLKCGGTVEGWIRHNGVRWHGQEQEPGSSRIGMEGSDGGRRIRARAGDPCTRLRRPNQKLRESGSVSEMLAPLRQSIRLHHGFSSGIMADNHATDRHISPFQDQSRNQAAMLRQQFVRRLLRWLSVLSKNEVLVGVENGCCHQHDPAKLMASSASTRPFPRAPSRQNADRRRHDRSCSC